MKQFTLTVFFLFTTTFSLGQQVPNEYFSLVKVADSLYNKQDYRSSAGKYSEAFKVNNWKAYSNDQYNAACSWALALVSDSSFFQLERIATEYNYTDYEHIINDPDLISLHDDKRWKPLLERIKQNKVKSEENLNMPLVAILDTIYNNDQHYRKQIDEIEEKYGWKSQQVIDYWKIIMEKDSINLIKVKGILNQYGWLGSDIVGSRGSYTLFLVIQHADIATQEKYLPMMRDAVKNGKAKGSNLALLEDRVALRQGKKQIYGSQIGQDPETGEHYVLPLIDPDCVDQRRAEVGLGPLSDYASHWQIKWNVEQYKKDLPKLEERMKRK